MQVTIEALGPRGDGFHKGDKGRIYVDRSVPGDELEVKTRRSKDGVMHGEITSIIKPSKDRAVPDCDYYDVCGGCTLQHVSEEFYQNWKQELVNEALARQNVKPSQFLEPVFIPGKSRRRVTFSALKQKNRVLIGYKKRRTKFINDIDHCMIADPDIMSLQPILKEQLAPVLQVGRVVDVLIQKINGIFDVVLTGEVGKKGTPDLSVMEMAADLIHKTKISRISWRETFHDEHEIIVEKEPVRISFGSLDISLPPASFLQPTLKGEKALVKAVMDLLPEKGRFADLYCGCGTFAGSMLANGTVDGFENNANAVRALNTAAKLNGKRLNAYERDLFREPLKLDEINNYDAVVFDPPRGGANKQAINLANSNVQTLIGVSCNPATFARDARILTEGGYTLESVQLIDQFTKSHHVELVGKFCKAI